MNALETEIRSRIETEGPLSVADYMALCLTHPSQGYYTSRQPIGGHQSDSRKSGDFITAPEVSQMYGELIGVWGMQVWQALGCPNSFNLVELGPGRGTLMADLLRAGKTLPGFTKGAKIKLLEISPTLQKQQRKALDGLAIPPEWISDICQLKDGPNIIIANEFLDALPFRQWQKQGASWHERAIGLNGTKLCFTLRPNKLDERELPAQKETKKNGTIFETAPAREGLVSTLAQNTKKPFRGSIVC